MRKEKKVRVKARGNYKEEIKKLSPKARKKFEAAHKHATKKEARSLDDNIPNEEHSSIAEGAFYRLSRTLRDKLRARYADKGWSYEDWLAKGKDKWAKRARVKLASGKAGRASKAGADSSPRRPRETQAPTLKIGGTKMLTKELRTAARLPKPPKNPYAALMTPMVIVPDDPNAKVVIADAGTIIRLADQSTLYRERVSPITRRADEILVHYGKAKTPTLGWITHRHALPALKLMKPSKGPTFLVTTRDENSLIAWEQLRLKVARTRKSDPNNWIARWLATHGSKYPRELREVTRLFGGKPIKNEAFEDRCIRLFSLILNTELDMATAKKGKNKKSKKGKDAVEKTSKKSKKNKSGKKKSGKKERVDSGTRITTKHDEHVIKRLVKENPRRAGSEKAKIWARLKKGMTVGEFVKKGGSRASVGRYIQNGWVKLLKPRGEE